MHHAYNFLRQIGYKGVRQAMYDISNKRGPRRVKIMIKVKVKPYFMPFVS
jgi:hypothetical protein